MRIFLLTLFCLGGTTLCCTSCGKTTEKSPPPVDVPKPHSTKQWAGEFALDMGKLKIVPGKTRRSELIAAFGEPKPENIHDETSNSGKLKGKILWGCDVSKFVSWSYTFGTALGLSVRMITKADGSDGIVIMATATGKTGAAIPNSDGRASAAALGGPLADIAQELSPHFAAAADLPKLKDTAKWRPDYAPLPGKLRVDKETEQIEKTWDMCNLELMWTDPDRNGIANAEAVPEGVTNVNPVAYLRREWKLSVSAAPQRSITSVCVEIPVHNSAWYQTEREALDNNWLRLRGEREVTVILERVRLADKLAVGER